MYLSSRWIQLSTNNSKYYYSFCLLTELICLSISLVDSHFCMYGNWMLYQQHRQGNWYYPCDIWSQIFYDLGDYFTHFEPASPVNGWKRKIYALLQAQHAFAIGVISGLFKSKFYNITLYWSLIRLWRATTSKKSSLPSSTTVVVLCYDGNGILTILSEINRSKIYIL